MTDSSDEGKKSKADDKNHPQNKSTLSPDLQKKVEKQRINILKLHHKNEELKKSITSLTAERDEFKDKYLRNLAEIDNFRKRVQKEKEEFQKYALSEFVFELLPVFDNLERAISAKNDTAAEKSIVSGLEMIYKQLINLLKKFNVEEIQAINAPFDPNLHQALAKEERSGITEPKIIEVYQKGFLYHKKLLRPALVKVAIQAEPSREEPQDK